MPQSCLRKQLDRYVRKRSVDDNIGQAVKLLLLTGVLFLMTGVIAWTEEGQFDLINLSLGAINLFVGLWAYLVYRHKLDLGEEPTQRLRQDADLKR